MKYNYQDLDFLLNTLYDITTNEKTNKCYKIKSINRMQIKIEDIKMPKSFDPKSILKANMQLMGSYNNKIYFKRLPDDITTHACTIVVGVYNNSNSNFNDMERGEVVNMAMSYITSEIALVEKLKFLYLPIMNFDITLKEVKKLNDDIANSYAKYQEETMLYVSVYEHFNKIKTLQDYLVENGKKFKLVEWKVLIFQVLYTLAKLNEKLKRFRHNKLDLNSIKVSIKKKDSTKKHIFKLGTKVFKVPDTEFEIKISDYEHSSTSDYQRNKDTDKVTENQYYDVHYFLSHLMNYLIKANIDIPELSVFINQMIPEKFKINDMDKFEGLNEVIYERFTSDIILPSIVLKKNNFFDDFIENIDMDLSASPISTNEKELKRYKGKQKDVRYSDNSITESSQYSYRLLGRNIELNKKNNKKTSRYNNIKDNSMIRGTRKMNLSRREVLKNKESGIFRMAESNKSAKSSDSEDLSNESSALDEQVFDESSIASSDYQMKRTKDKKKGKKTSVKKGGKRSKKSSKGKKYSESSVKLTSMSSTSLGDDVEVKSKGKKQAASELSDGFKSSLLNNLPEGYSGELPENLRGMVDAKKAGMAVPQMMPEGGMGSALGAPMGNPMGMGGQTKFNRMKDLLGIQNYVPPEGNALPPGLQQMALSQGAMGAMGAMGAPTGVSQPIPMGMPAEIPGGLPMGMAPGMGQGMPMPMGMPEGPAAAMGPMSAMPQGMPMAQMGGSKLLKNKDGKFFF
jgi:hypothetical protein